MRKRTLALLLAGTFVFGTAAACSDDAESGEDTETTEAEDTETTEAETEAEATTTTAAA